MKEVLNLPRIEIPGDKASLGFFRSIKDEGNMWHKIWVRRLNEKKEEFKYNLLGLQCAQEVDGLRKDIRFAIIKLNGFDFSKNKQIEELASRVEMEIIKELQRIPMNEKLGNISDVVYKKIIKNLDDDLDPYVRRVLQIEQDKKEIRRNKKLTRAMGLATISILLIAGISYVFSGGKVQAEDETRSGDFSAEVGDIDEELIRIVNDKSKIEITDIPVLPIDLTLQTGGGSEESFLAPTPWYKKWGVDWSKVKSLKIVFPKLMTEEDKDEIHNLEMRISNVRLVPKDRDEEKKESRLKKNINLVDELMQKSGMERLEREITPTVLENWLWMASWMVDPNRALILRSSSPVRLALYVHSGRSITFNNLVAERFRLGAEKMVDNEKTEVDEGEEFVIWNGDIGYRVKIMWVSPVFPEKEFMTQKIGNPSEPWEPRSLDLNAIGLPEELRMHRGFDIAFCEELEPGGSITAGRRVVSGVIVGIVESPRK